LIIGVAGILALTTWAAFFISRPLLSPVHQLAAQLSHIDPRERSVRMGNAFSGNELEPIARSIDSFLERLDGFVEREQAFTATASHELRTPLAVIQGAVELLSEHYAQQSGAEKALERIQRAVREMSEFTTALLSLAREPDAAISTDSTCDVTSLLPRIVDDQRATADKAIVLELDNVTPLRVSAPDSMVAMVIGNIIRNALQHGEGAAVNVGLHERTLAVSNAGRIADKDFPHLFEPRFTTRIGGHGMGLYLARRICDRYGWQIRIDSGASVITAVLAF
jgi:signal transduction histidine kinase